MAEYVLARRFLRDLAEWEGRASRLDVEALDEALARIADNAALAGRVPSFCDPLAPSYLYRAGAVLIHYRVADRDNVEFLNLFFQRA